MSTWRPVDCGRSTRCSGASRVARYRRYMPDKDSEMTDMPNPSVVTQETVFPALDALTARGEPIRSPKQVRKEMKKYLPLNATIGADYKIQEQIDAWHKRRRGEAHDSGLATAMHLVRKAEAPADPARVLNAEIDRLSGVLAARTSERDAVQGALDACRDDLAKAVADTGRAAELREVISNTLAAAEADRAVLQIRLGAMEQELREAKLTVRSLQEELLRTQAANRRQPAGQGAHAVARFLRRFREILPVSPLRKSRAHSGSAGG